MKYDQLITQQALSALFFSVLIVIMGLLFFEYRFFHQQSQELVELKEEYVAYIAKLKHTILECEHFKEQVDEKKSSTYL